MRDGKCDRCGNAIKFFSVQRCRICIGKCMEAMSSMNLTKNRPEPSPSFDFELGRRYGIR